MVEGDTIDRRPVQEWKTYIQPVMMSKQKEFKLIGYKEVTEDEIWQCLVETVWKENPEKRLYEVIQDVFHLPASTYMNHIRINALAVEEDDLHSSIQALTKEK